MKDRVTGNSAERLSAQTYLPFLSEDYIPEQTAVHLQTAVRNHSEQAFFLQPAEYSED